jgi:arylsulfatase A-like enzyme
MYDPLVKVPLLVKFPAASARGERRGERSEALVSLVDLAPTILAACATAGLTTTPPPPGLNLADPAAGRECVFAENRTFGPVAMARTRTHKLLLSGDHDRAPDALFDLVADPHELDNRIDDPGSARALSELRAALTRWALFDTPVPTYLDEDAAQIDAPNVPPPDPARRAEHRAYFEVRVRRALASETSSESSSGTE